MILLIDNYDSFSYNLFQQAAAIQPDMRVVRNDALTVSEIEGLNPSHIILSPGPGYPKDAGICEEVVSRLGGSIPILGVCLGHQAICEAYGARVGYASRLMHGKTSEAELGDSEIFKGLGFRTTVGRYHSLAVDRTTLPADLRITSVADDGEVMSVEDAGRKVFGLQFHPESIYTEHGKRMIENFLSGVI